jgi:hypothetical protein
MGSRKSDWAATFGPNGKNDTAGGWLESIASAVTPATSTGLDGQAQRFLVTAWYRYHGKGLYTAGRMAARLPIYVPAPPMRPEGRKPYTRRDPRTSCGENSSSAKMTQKDIDELREDRRSGMTIDQIFLKWHALRGISHQNVRKILMGLSWK